MELVLVCLTNLTVMELVPVMGVSASHGADVDVAKRAALAGGVVFMFVGWGASSEPQRPGARRARREAPTLDHLLHASF
jgi:hypothetical protein